MKTFSFATLVASASAIKIQYYQNLAGTITVWDLSPFLEMDYPTYNKYATMLDEDNDEWLKTFERQECYDYWEEMDENKDGWDCEDFGDWFAEAISASAGSNASRSSLYLDQFQNLLGKLGVTDEEVQTDLFDSYKLWDTYMSLGAQKIFWKDVTCQRGYVDDVLDL